MFFRFNIFTITWAVFIFILCAVPGDELPDLSYWEQIDADKIAHIFIFVVLEFFMLIGFNKQYQFMFLRFNAEKYSIWICLGYGGIIEILQNFFFVGRYASIVDFVANSLGCLVGLLIFKLVYQLKKV